ncbi:uncharacterized protein PAF06_007392 [Gastrophryne carolinensis]
MGMIDGNIDVAEGGCLENLGEKVDTNWEISSDMKKMSPSLIDYGNGTHENATYQQRLSKAGFLNLSPAFSFYMYINNSTTWVVCGQSPRTLVNTYCTKQQFKTLVLLLLIEDMISIDPVTILLSVVTIFFLAHVFSNHKYKNFPPGPRPLPIIGNVHSINMKRPHETFIKLSKRYGTVFSVQIGMRKMVILCGYDTIKDALLNHAEALSDRPITPLVYNILKNYGVIFSNGENWQVMRRFTLSTLRDYGMGKKTIEDKISEEAECMIQSFKSHGGKPFNSHSVMNTAVANIIVSILQSQRYEYDDPSFQKLICLVNESFRLAGSPLARLYDSFPFIIGLLGGHKKITENNFELHRFIRKMFTKQRKELDVNNQRNLIDAFLSKQQEGKPESTKYFHDENLTVLVDNLFVAGMETTSTTLRWGLLLMMKYPDVQRKVQDEIDRVIGTARPKVEHRKQMPYTDAVIHEIQRFGDIVPGSVPRTASQDLTFRGYFIPKGTIVIPLLSSVLRDGAYFEKPYEFYPEHFLNAQGNFKKNEAFIPFSIGKRICAGETLAKMELFLFFTALLQAFRFQAPHGAVLDCTPALGITNAPLPFDICAIDPNVYSNPKYKNFPPGPRPLPIIGNVHSIDMKKPHKTFIELSKKYGTIFSVRVGMTKMVILCGYDTIRDALLNHAEALSDRPKRPLIQNTHKDNGVIFSNGENWQVMRRFTISTLRDYGMGRKTIEDKISEEVDCLIHYFKSHKGKPFNNHSIMNTAVANIIVSILLSHRYDYEDPTIQKLICLVNENVIVAGSPLARLYDSFPYIIGLLGGHKKFTENKYEMYRFIQKTFTKQRKELDVNNQRNLIDAFLAKQQEGKPESKKYFHDENLTVLVDNLFFAGMETISTTLRWGILLMMKYPNVQKKVQDEIDRVIGTARPKVEHRKQMPYTDAVIHEIQRFGDIVPGNVPRATTQDLTFRGYFIPKGTFVIPVLSSVLRDKAYFEKPYEFYPEHFLDAQGNFKKNEAFIPFSIGKRVCAGETLAKMELFLFFTALLQAFKFQAPPGAVLDLTPALGITNAPSPYDACAIDRY